MGSRWILLGRCVSSALTWYYDVLLLKLTPGGYQLTLWSEQPVAVARPNHSVQLIHDQRSQRLPAVRAHRRFVAAIKGTVRRTHGSVPDPATVLPTIIGAEPLDFKVPPAMEQPFGYRGNLGFVEFSYSPRTHGFGYSDGGDHVPSDAQLWREFVNHPLVWAEIGEDDCPTLYGKFQRWGGRFCRQLDRLNQEWHCVLVDRQERQQYLWTMKQVVFFFPLTEPKNGATTQFFRMVCSLA